MKDLRIAFEYTVFLACLLSACIGIRVYAADLQGDPFAPSPSTSATTQANDLPPLGDESTTTLPIGRTTLALIFVTVWSVIGIAVVWSAFRNFGEAVRGQTLPSQARSAFHRRFWAAVVVWVVLMAATWLFSSELYDRLNHWRA